jgi:mitochondrial translocator assembly and maintenance protein 41
MLEHILFVACEILQVVHLARSLSSVTVTRLIRVSYGDYRLDTIPKGMAIPVPYKPVAKQRAKGDIVERKSSQPYRERMTKRDQVSPVKWVNSLQARTMSTLSNDRSSLDGQLTSRQALHDEILSLFPQEQLVYSFGYGSGVFSQTLKDANRKHEGMLDLILVVDDTRRFHEANMEIFPRHYAPWLRYGGPTLASKVQRQFPLNDAHVLFHVVDDPIPMKYGVVAQEDLVRDMTEWETLYLSGRLHKPTLALMDPLPDWFETAQHQNLTSAVAAAMLLMAAGPTHQSWPDFFRSVASLSYTGDFRMQLGGEDPQKINKLVHAPGQLDRFQAMYKPVLENFEREGIISCNFVEVCNGDCGEKGITINGHWRESLAYLQNYLPASLKDKLSPTSDSDGVVVALSAALTATVAPAARHQSFKGIATLGFRKSIQYASAKLSKGLFATRT